MTATDPAADWQRTLLLTTLQLAVPAWQERLRDLPIEGLLALVPDDVDTIGSHGDALQYRTDGTAEAFNSLARGLAIAALLAPGGVDFADAHWCAIPGCTAVTRYDHASPADDDLDDRPAPGPPPRPVRDLPDIATWPPPAA